MRALCLGILVTIVTMFAGCSACTEQHNPRPDWARFEAAREVGTHDQPPKLTAEGKIPAPTPVATQVAANPAMTTFTTYCSGCHGPNGKGDGPAAAALNPKPRNFTDKTWQAKVNDDHIIAVITKGGAANGLSGAMPPWGGTLTPDQIKGLVSVVRGFGK